MYPDTITIQPLDTPPNAVIEVPGSKSITNRAMILAALAAGESTLYNALDSDDTRVMAESLHRLGFNIFADIAARTIRVVGRAGAVPASQAELMLNNSGTSIRFLTALTSLGAGTFRLDGNERMRERPQQELLDALKGMGVEAQSENNNGSPPIIVEANGLLKGGEITMNAEASSQFVTAILMVAPYAQIDVRIRIEGSLRPFYVDITCKMMEQWGAFVGGGSASYSNPSLSYHVPSQQVYAPQTAYHIEPDASSASYLFGAAAITGGTVTVPGLGPDALQGDVKFAMDVLAEMGCTVTANTQAITVKGPPSGELRGVDRDMSAISDTSLTLAAIAPFASSPTTIRNIAHSRRQECDRIAAACTELARLGVKVEEHSDGLTIYPASHISPAQIRTYNDHRVAMSFALVGLRSPGVTIENPGCVVKTFPGYWECLERLRK
jgi:3-phosphoshikimate 1-carboxyvinyltransferase